jgi:hypothetical protein
MYMILIWQGDYLTAKKNDDGSIWLAESIVRADREANEIDEKLNCDSTRVISIEGIVL